MIYKEHLLHNLKHIKSLIKTQKIFAVVKGNAYGLGIKNIVPILEDHVDGFAVARMSEAVALIKTISIRTHKILVFSGAYSDLDFIYAQNNNIIPIINNWLQLQLLLDNYSKYTETIYVKVNLGMNRFGFKQHDLNAVINKLRTNNFYNICIVIHPNLSYINQNQTQRLLDNVAKLSTRDNVEFSVANSAVVASQSYNLDNV